MERLHSTSYPWWKRVTFYQIYPRSFCDSNGDGIGDLPGIISKLDFIKELGYNVVWFSPFYKSPQFDHGYDISDYRDIAPEYGTIADCERLIKEMHDRDIKIVLDMVLNHTSHEHPWFLESKSTRDNPKRDWYIWRDGRKPKGKKPPNNWWGITLGSAWHYDTTTEQWYYAAFLPEQPDLNWRNDVVKQEMFDTLRFWLRKGVDGFRLDIINSIYEEADVTKNKPLFHPYKYNLNHPDTFQLVKELRGITDEFSSPERFLVGEVSGPLPLIKKYYGEAITPVKAKNLHLAFHPQTLRVGFSARAYRQLFTRMEAEFAEPCIPTLLSTNHDRMRRISRLGNDVRKAKVSATFQLTARGVPFVYYGEEIGMIQDYIPTKHAQDPMAQKYRWVPQWGVNVIARKILKETLNRDECRTPMQWDASPNAGFSKEGVKTWLPVTRGYEKINVAVEEPDQESLLNCYKRLLHLREVHPALNSGTFALMGIKDGPSTLLAYERATTESGQPETLQGFLNFGKKNVKCQVPRALEKVVFSTHQNTSPIQEKAINLEPFEGIIVQLK